MSKSKTGSVWEALRNTGPFSPDNFNTLLRNICIMGWLKTHLVNMFLQNIPLLVITETNQSENMHGETLTHGCYVVRFRWAVVHGVLFKGHHNNLLFTIQVNSFQLQLTHTTIGIYLLHSYQLQQKHYEMFLKLYKTYFLRRGIPET